MYDRIVGSYAGLSKGVHHQAGRKPVRLGEQRAVSFARGTCGSSRGCRPAPWAEVVQCPAAIRPLVSRESIDDRGALGR